MFYQYGAKNLLAKYYQVPNYRVIVEPFAGSAAYSCFHLKRNREMRAVIIDKNDNIAAAWDFIKHCSANDVREYPVPEIGSYTTDFLFKTCTSSNSATQNAKMKVTKRMLEVFEYQRRRILDLLWIRNRISFIHDDYRAFPNIEATWFIDAPYQKPTDRLLKNASSRRNAEYAELSEYAKSRKGQVIVCEKDGANWLPFERFKTNKNSLDRKYAEVVWYSRHWVQLDFFDEEGTEMNADMGEVLDARSEGIGEPDNAFDDTHGRKSDEGASEKWMSVNESREKERMKKLDVMTGGGRINLMDGTAARDAADVVDKTDCFDFGGYVKIATVCGKRDKRKDEKAEAAKPVEEPKTCAVKIPEQPTAEQTFKNGGLDPYSFM